MTDEPMPEVSNIADIAVLKYEVAGLHAAITEVGVKMDKLIDIHVTLSVQNERLEQVVSELGRVRDSVNKEIGVLETRSTAISEHSAITREKLDRWLNRAIGGFLVAVAFLGVIQYTILEKLNAVDATNAAVSRNSAQVEMLQRALSDHLTDFTKAQGNKQ